MSKRNPGPTPPPGATANGHLPTSTLFNTAVRDALIKAAATPGTEKDRNIAIAKATQQARSKHPNLFKE